MHKFEYSTTNSETLVNEKNKRLPQDTFQLFQKILIL